MDTSACPRVCVPHTVFQNERAQGVKSSVGLGPQLGLGTLHLQVQRLHVLGDFEDARIEILLGQRLVIGQLLEELHVVDGCQILLAGIVETTQGLAAISQLGSILQDLQSITRQVLKALLAPSSNSLMLLGSFFLGSLAMSCIAQSWKVVSYCISYIGVNKGRIYIRKGPGLCIAESNIYIVPI